MKKTYEKPEIMFENFTLTTNIAGDCEVKTWTPNSGNCAYEITDEFGDTSAIFTSAMTGICTTTEADGEYNGICYHVPYGDNLFNS